VPGWQVCAVPHDLSDKPQIAENTAFSGLFTKKLQTASQAADGTA